MSDNSSGADMNAIYLCALIIIYVLKDSSCVQLIPNRSGRWFTGKCVQWGWAAFAIGRIFYGDLKRKRKENEAGLME